jgi:hypothetical protein
MKQSDAEARIEEVVAVGAAYQPAHDPREVLGHVSAGGMTLAAVTAAVYAAVTDQWSPATYALIGGAAAAALTAVLIPWTRLRRNWLLISYWMALAVIIGAVYVFAVPTFAVLLLLPMMGLTIFFWDSRGIVVLNLAGAALVFALPLLTGDAPDAATALIVTLPSLIAVASLAGVLAARVNALRLVERGRYKATIEALSTALTARDGYTGQHSEETLELVQAICRELRLPSRACEYISDVALLHDIGKIGIPNEILHEPGRLDEEQWATMKKHPVIGERIVVTVPGLEEVARAIRHEHERWDGGGYPDGLVAGAIPLASRIVLVCDAFHAMTSDRPYRMAMSVDQARLELSKNAGTQFDPTVVGALLNVLDAAERADRNGLGPAADGSFFGIQLRGAKAS